MKIQLIAALIVSMLAIPGFARDWGPRGLSCDINQSSSVFSSTDLAVAKTHQQQICEQGATEELKLMGQPNFDFNPGPHSYGNNVSIIDFKKTYINGSQSLGYFARVEVFFMDMQPQPTQSPYISMVFDQNFNYLGTSDQVSNEVVDPAALSQTDCDLVNSISSNGISISGFSIAPASSPGANRDLTLKTTDGKTNVVTGACTNDFAHQSVTCSADPFSLTVDFSTVRDDLGQGFFDAIGALAGGNASGNSISYYAGSASGAGFLSAPSTSVRCGAAY